MRQINVYFETRLIVPFTAHHESELEIIVSIAEINQPVPFFVIAFFFIGQKQNCFYKKNHGKVVGSKINIAA